MLNIKHSVGNRGRNENIDVVIVQQSLNKHHRQGKTSQLKVDGVVGAKTIARIKNFQQTIVKIVCPDGRVDPKGRTFFYLKKSPIMAVTTLTIDSIPASKPVLTSFVTPDVKPTTNQISSSPTLSTAPITIIQKTKVTYGNNAVAEVVSCQTENVLHLALAIAEMPHAVITQSIRTIDEQTNIMYNNAVRKAKGVKNLPRYAATGKAVLKIYDDNKDKSEQEIKRLMRKKIAKKPYNVSHHVATREQYKKLNVIDIGRGSTSSKCGNKYNRSKFSNALESLKALGFISYLQPEGNCWHVEIPQ